jgi:hypothetical protein
MAYLRGATCILTGCGGQASHTELCIDLHDELGNAVGPRCKQGTKSSNWIVRMWRLAGGPAALESRPPRRVSSLPGCALPVKRPLPNTN